MQQTKRRSKKGLTLLALAIALLVVAIVPAGAMGATANGVLEPGLVLDGADGQGGHVWFGATTDPVDGYYSPWYNDALEASWNGIVIEPVYGGGVIDVLAINWIIDGDAAGHAFSYVHPGGPPQYVSFGAASHPSEGLHTIDSWLQETTATAHVLVRKATVTDTFGIDQTDPEWQHVTIDEDCYYNIPVEFSAIASDDYGSGVAPTPTATWTDPVDGAMVADGVPLTWNKWIVRSDRHGQSCGPSLLRNGPGRLHRHRHGRQRQR